MSALGRRIFLVLIQLLAGGAWLAVSELKPHVTLPALLVHIQHFL